MEVHQSRIIAILMFWKRIYDQPIHCRMPKQTVNVVPGDICKHLPNLTGCHGKSLGRVPNEYWDNHPHQGQGRSTAVRHSCTCSKSWYEIYRCCRPTCPDYSHILPIPPSVGYVHCTFTDASHLFTVKCITYISVFIAKIIEVFSGRSFAISFVHRLVLISGLQMNVIKKSDFDPRVGLGLCMNNLTNVVTYQWDGREARGLTKGLAECPRIQLVSSYASPKSLQSFIHSFIRGSGWPLAVFRRAFQPTASAEA